MSDTPLTDASISWHTAYSGYGADRVSMQVDHVEVFDARQIERELRYEIDEARAEVARLREALRPLANARPDDPPIWESLQKARDLLARLDAEKQA